MVYQQRWDANIVQGLLVAQDINIEVSVCQITICYVLTLIMLGLFG